MTSAPRGHWPHDGAAVLEREMTLPADSVSPRDARRLYCEAVVSTGHEEWRDAGELAVSEVVTNALLHAHTSIHLYLAVYGDGVCVQVRDFNPDLPVARNYDDEASTGRGLGLVATISRDCGIESLGEEGKVIWFCIGEPAERSVEDLLDMWAIEEELPSAADAAPTVVLQGMPPTLWLSAREHHDALLRELALYAVEHPIDVDFGVIDHARGSISGPLARVVEAAHEAGLTRPPLPEGHPSPLPWVPDAFDLELSIAPEDAPAFLALPDALDLGERLALGGQLLARPALPEIVAVRDWACEQVVAQLSGIPPSPWAGAAQRRFETESVGPAMADESVHEVALVRDSDRGVVAADESNRILAISRPLAKALGWECDALVGRRVVTLVPPHLREAHVAGFSRHLTTGEQHVIGVPLELPVLRADGTEVQCRFLIERAPETARKIYLAWIDPIEGSPEP